MIEANLDLPLGTENPKNQENQIEIEKGKEIAEPETEITNTPPPPEIPHNMMKISKEKVKEIEIEIKIDNMKKKNNKKNKNNKNNKINRKNNKKKINLKKRKMKTKQ